MKINTCPLICFILLLNPLFSSEVTSEKKLKMSFYVLQENFSIDNRDPQNLNRNTQLISLAESSIENTLNYYPDNIEFTLDTIRTLYVEGNYYLRTENFSISQQKLLLAKALCEKHFGAMTETDMFKISVKLAKTHPTLPALYSIVLHELGQLPIYHKDSPISFSEAENYLQQALAIREVIDNNPNRFLNVPDNNSLIGDVIIIKRSLSQLFIEAKEFEKAEEIIFSLLSCNDSYNQLLNLRNLVRIYHQKAHLTVGEEQKNCFKIAMKYARACINVLENVDHFRSHTRIASTYTTIGKLYADQQNPTQNLVAAKMILEQGSINCPEQLKVSLGNIKEELGITLAKLSEKEIEESIKIRQTQMEIENVDALKHLKDPQTHLKNYVNLGDLFLAQNQYFVASAFYGNGLCLAASMSNPSIEIPKFYQKLENVECTLLNLQKHPYPAGEYENLIISYHSNLTNLRANVKEMLVENIEIQKIYAYVRESYLNLMRKMFIDLFDLLGPPPTQNFAFIAFGSMGRGCVTPYSDVEWAILVDDEADKSYFIKFSEFFSIRLHALGESPIAGCNVESMNWLTRDDGPASKGFRLDPVSGHGIIPHIPLFGKFELIATPSQLAKIFNPRLDFPIYLKSLFFTHTKIFGNEELVKEYQNEITQLFDGPEKTRTKFAKELMLKDINSYYSRLGNWLDQKNSYSIKYDFYRPLTLILDGLAIQQNIHAVCPWDLINILEKKGIIDKDLKVLLLLSLDEIARIQLNAYLKYNKQYPIIFSDTTEWTQETSKYYYDEQKLVFLLQAIINFQNKIGYTEKENSIPEFKRRDHWEKGSGLD